MVDFKTNSQTIQNKKLKLDSKNIKVADLSEGLHCTLPVVYDWQAVAGVLQGYILSQSPKFKLQERHFDMEMKEEWEKSFFETPIAVEFDLDWPNRDKGFVTLEIRAKNQNGDKESFNVSLPLSEFDYVLRNKEITETDQQMLTRWLNQNLSVKIGVKDQKSLLRISWPAAL
ncbi:hypothetical protein D3C87_1657890 [compost metagenome]